MNTLTLIFTLIFVVIVKWILNSYQRKQINLPPGPRPLPVIGNILDVTKINAKKPFIAIQTLAKKYGDVMSIQMGQTFVVIISSYDTIKSVVLRDEFMGRPGPVWSQKRTFDKEIGILRGDIPNWKEHRKFASKNLREFGFGKKDKMEVLVQEEITHFFEHIQGKITNNKPLAIKGIFDLPLLNTIISMVCGLRLGLEDQYLHQLMELIHTYFSSMKMGGGLSSSFPFLSPLLPAYYKQQCVHKEMHAFIRKIINDARGRNDRKATPKSFLDVFINSMESSESDKEIFNEENLIVVIYDFFMAGAETTPSVLEFLVLYLILNPDIQKKISNEIGRVVGRDRPAYEDRSRMPYTEAVLYEVLRIAPVSPLTRRGTTVDVNLNGYHIPKRTLILLNIYDVHMDPAVWEHPQEFRPERFLNDSGNVCNTEKILPFSLGKRNCLGETLARMDLFLFTTRLLQKFTIETVPNMPNPTTEPSVGITLAVQPFSAVFKLREE